MLVDTDQSLPRQKRQYSNFPAIPVFPHMIKTILALLNGGGADRAVLNAALAIARPLGGHIDCCHNPASTALAFAKMPQDVPMTGAALREVMDCFTQCGDPQAADAIRHFADFCGNHGLPVGAPIPYAGVSAGFLHVRGAPVERLCFLARFHDIVVMERPTEGNGFPADLAPRILLNGGKPLLLLPEHAVFDKEFDTIMLCWKDTAESARAVAAAVPLLKHAKRVILASVDEGHGTEQASIQALAAYLEWHDVHVQVRTLLAGDQPTMDVLWSSARDCHADLVVMGGYNRGPIREMLFGGCTDSALLWGDLPLLVVH